MPGYSGLKANSIEISAPPSAPNDLIRTSFFVHESISNTDLYVKEILDKNMFDKILLLHG
jgi:hypothetical protein